MHRVTTILGAGINLEYFERSEATPTCENITKKIVSTSDYTFEDGYSVALPQLLNGIHRYLSKIYLKKNPDNGDRVYCKIHFEKIFHVLEMLDAYDKVWLSERGEDKRDDKDLISPLFAYFVDSKCEYNPKDIRSALRWMVVLIMEFINEYDVYYQNHKTNLCCWYYNFWREPEFKWDIFTLNYDTTLENTLNEYEDGFETIDGQLDFQRFNPLKLLNAKSHTVNHLHGCILYGFDNMHLYDDEVAIYGYGFYDLYKWINFEKSCNVWFNMTTSVPNSQNGDSIFPSPIITGLNKTDKILPLPFSTYKNNLTNRLIQNNALLIAGYSFGDDYINKELERVRLYHGDRMRVVIVDYWDKIDNYEDERDMIKAYIESIDEKNLSHHLVNFMCRIMKVKELNYHRDGFGDLSYENYFVSNNRQLMLFVGGWKKAISSFANNIYDFLKS